MVLKGSSNLLFLISWFWGLTGPSGPFFSFSGFLCIGHQMVAGTGAFQRLFCKCACLLSCFSHVQLRVTLRTAAYQASLFMGVSRQEYWSGLSCPPPGNLSNPGIKLASLKSPSLAGRFFTTGTTWEAPQGLSHTSNSGCWLLVSSQLGLLAKTPNVASPCGLCFLMAWWLASRS